MKKLFTPQFRLHLKSFIKRQYTTKKPFRLGIRREDKNCWERRVPLVPRHVKQLVDNGIEVYIEPSTIRCFTDEEYEKVGAIITDDLSPANTIICVKEVPPRLLLNDKTYMYFSHTIKAQPQNMPALDAIMQKNIRLIDYERITDDQGNRLVRFGPFAGYAGTIDTLHMLGERLLTQYGYSSPFINISFSKNYASLDKAKEAVKTVGEQIATVGLPKAISPLTFVVTGSGSVSTSVQEILDLLPHKKVSPFELKEIIENKNMADRHVIYYAVATAEHMVEPIDPSAPFDKKDYYENPHKYKPIFHEKVLPYARVIINAMYWDQNYPRLATIDQTKQLIADNKFLLYVLGDITCDVGGSFEFFIKDTSIGDPAYVYDIMNDKVYNSTVTGPGVAILGVSHLPAEFPKSSSSYFGDCLLPFVPKVLESDHNVPFEQQVLPPEVKRAVITSNNELTPGYQYITKLRTDYKRAHRDRKILLLGSGSVARPIVDYLMRKKNYLVTIASNDLKSAQELCRVDEARCNALKLDVRNSEELDKLVSGHELVLSMVSASMHPLVAEACIKHKKNMITASYISPQMKDLHEKAKDAGISIINELGLDPGIDHMVLKQMIEDVYKEDGKIISVKSICGALPEPKASNNPLGYKFSWSPEGVFLAAQQPARFLYDGVVIDIPGEILTCVAKKLDIYPGYNFVVLPNRDSLKYIDVYGLDRKYLKTMLRGTLRYPGFSSFFRALLALGLLDQEVLLEKNPIMKTKLTWREFLTWRSGIPALMSRDVTDDQIMRALADKIAASIIRKQVAVAHKNLYIANTFGSETDSQVFEQAREAVAGMKKLGMFSRQEYVNITETTTTASAVCELLKQKLAYKEGERDMVFMNHELLVEYPTTGLEKISSTLLLYGEPEGYSATEKTVGMPVAIAADLLIQEKFNAPHFKGVLGPDHKDLYEPVLQLLAKEGIKTEKEIERMLD